MRQVGLGWDGVAVAGVVCAPLFPLLTTAIPHPPQRDPGTMPPLIHRLWSSLTFGDDYAWQPAAHADAFLTLLGPGQGQVGEGCDSNHMLTLLGQGQGQVRDCDLYELNQLAAIQNHLPALLITSPQFEPCTRANPACRMRRLVPLVFDRLDAVVRNPTLITSFPLPRARMAWWHSRRVRMCGGSSPGARRRVCLPTRTRRCSR